MLFGNDNGLLNVTDTDGNASNSSDRGPFGFGPNASGHESRALWVSHRNHRIAVPLIRHRMPRVTNTLVFPPIPRITVPLVRRRMYRVALMASVFPQIRRVVVPLVAPRAIRLVSMTMRPPNAWIEPEMKDFGCAVPSLILSPKNPSVSQCASEPAGSSTIMTNVVVALRPMEHRMNPLAPTHVPVHVISKVPEMEYGSRPIGSWPIWKTPRTPITRFASIHVSRSVSPMALVPCPVSKNAPPKNNVLRRDTHHHHHTVFPFRETLVLHFNKYI